MLRDFPYLDPAVRGDLQAGIVMRDPAAGNAMESILQLRPIGLLPDGSDPDIMRGEAIEAALVALEAEPTLQSNWFQLLAFGQSGLSEKDRNRLDKVFEDFDLADLDLEATTTVHGEYGLVIDTRLRLGGPIDDNRLGQKLYDLAAQQASRFKGRFALDDGGGVALSWNRVVDAAARAAEAEDISQAFERLSHFCLAIATAWPASAASLRKVFDAYARRLSPSDGAPLWKVLVALRAWP